MVTIRSDDFTRRDKVALKTADETVNNTTTLQADDALLVALGANETWILRYFIKFNSNATANFKYSYTVPSGTTYSSLLQGQNSGGTDVHYFRTSGAQDVDGEAADWAVTAVAVVKTGSTAGNFV